MLARYFPETKVGPAVCKQTINALPTMARSPRRFLITVPLLKCFARRVGFVLYWPPSTEPRGLAAPAILAIRRRAIPGIRVGLSHSGFSHRCNSLSSGPFPLGPTHSRYYGWRGKFADSEIWLADSRAHSTTK